jgi:hypothetical protein
MPSCMPSVCGIEVMRECSGAGRHVTVVKLVKQPYESLYVY